ncbi:UDP-N-acetylmuramate dehydrogenase [Thermocrinis sp.]|uniref:UDP-N-acetylmuramate dehydrogenase n=1 Tax=Thermocrinis sp. TaxID=2024383 RepID=UPI002FDDEA25
MKLERKVSLSKYTTIRVGGVADFIAYPKDFEDVKECIRISQWEDMPLFVLGRGANTIFGDFRGMVINTKLLDDVKVKDLGYGLEVTAQAGVSLNTLVELGLRENLEGIYKLAGFPATVGGAIAMNAGAFGYEISNHLKSVKFMLYNGEVVQEHRENLEFSYRRSPFPEKGIVLEAVFFFPKVDYPIYQEYESIRLKRKKTQPVQMPTAGSTFKNPPSHSAGRLLEEVGMKGYKLGNIAFSEKHANFLVNLGKASFEEVIKIIDVAKRRVLEEFGVELEEEVRLIESSSPYGWKVCGA